MRGAALPHPPPSGNTPAPINTGGSFQSKSGDLTIKSQLKVNTSGNSANGLVVPNGLVGIGTTDPINIAAQDLPSGYSDPNFFAGTVSLEVDSKSSGGSAITYIDAPDDEQAGLSLAHDWHKRWAIANMQEGVDNPNVDNNLNFYHDHTKIGERSGSVLTLTEEENMGLGTTDPGVDDFGSYNFADHLFFEIDSKRKGGGAAMYMDSPNNEQVGVSLGNSFHDRWAIVNIAEGGHENDSLKFWHDHTGIGGTKGQVLTMSKEGNVGIGTYDPINAADKHSAFEDSISFEISSKARGGDAFQWMEAPDNELVGMSLGNSYHDRWAMLNTASGDALRIWHDHTSVGGTSGGIISIYENGNVYLEEGQLIEYSDKRLKKSIQGLKDSSLEKITNLRGVSFERKGKDKEGEELGLIAQEVEEIYPELVEENKDGFKGIKYNNFIAPIIEAIKELNNKLESVVNKTSELFNKHEQQQEEIEELKERVRILESKLQNQGSIKNGN